MSAEQTPDLSQRPTPREEDGSEGVRGKEK